MLSATWQPGDSEDPRDGGFVFDDPDAGAGDGARYVLPDWEAPPVAADVPVAVPVAMPVLQPAAPAIGPGLEVNPTAPDEGGAVVFGGAAPESVLRAAPDLQAGLVAASAAEGAPAGAFVLCLRRWWWLLLLGLLLGAVLGRAGRR